MASSNPIYVQVLLCHDALFSYAHTRARARLTRNGFPLASPDDHNLRDRRLVGVGGAGVGSNLLVPQKNYAQVYGFEVAYVRVYAYRYL